MVRQSHKADLGREIVFPGAYEGHSNLLVSDLAKLHSFTT